MVRRWSGAGLWTAMAAMAVGAVLWPARPLAASCCGGGGGSAAMAGRDERAMADLAVEAERYDGYFDGRAHHLPDPAGAALAQYRLNLGLAARLAAAWQVGLALPLVLNDNRFGGISSRTHGPGDTAVSLWFEPLDQRSSWRLATLGDLVPAVTVGATLTVPTGVSPYDDIQDSLDVTGRGFYRLDGTVLVDKGYRAWSSALALAYGTSFERWTNRSSGAFVPPRRRNLGNRTSASLSVGYKVFLGTGGQTLATTAALSWLHEDTGTLTSGMEKSALAVTLAWSSTDSDWSARASLAHALQADGWGRSFPTTDTLTLGVRRALR